MFKLDPQAIDDVSEQDKKHFLHPWQLFDSYRDNNKLQVARGEGCHVYDSAGKKYFDAVGGLWCNNIGLGRREMADAIAEQAYQLSYASAFTDLTNLPAVELATRLANLAPGSLNHVFFTTGGSTAVDSAYRMIQFYQNCRGKHEKKHMISRINAYHGSTFASMSIGGKPTDHKPDFDFIEDTMHHLSCPDFYRAPQGMTEAQFVDFLVQEFEDKIAEIGPARVAAFFAEPIMGSGGVIVPPGDYLRRIWEVCQANDILYVSDEVVTAFGRLGHWFASLDEFGIQPDIITSAKGLTSGYVPMGAVLYSDAISDVIDEPGHGRCFANGYTYSGHPVACAAALKNMEIIERENLLEHVVEVGQYFEQQLATLEDLPIVGQVRGRKFMMCVEYVADRSTRELFPSELDIGKRIADIADRRGLITRPIGHLNVMSPPLVMTRADVDMVAGTLRESIQETVVELRREGSWIS